MKNIFKKIHLSGVVGAATSIAGLIGLAGQPDIAPALPHLMPPEWAAAVTAVGIAIQAVTRAVHKGDVREVPKSR